MCNSAITAVRSASEHTEACFFEGHDVLSPEPNSSSLVDGAKHAKHGDMHTTDFNSFELVLVI